MLAGWDCAGIVTMVSSANTASWLLCSIPLLHTYFVTYIAMHAAPSMPTGFTVPANTASWPSCGIPLLHSVETYVAMHTVPSITTGVCSHLQPSCHLVCLAYMFGYVMQTCSLHQV